MTKKMKDCEALSMDEILGAIDKMGILELMERAEEEDVCLSGLDTVEEMQECIKLHLTQRTNADPFSLWNDERQRKLKEENELKRHELATLFETTQACLAANSTHLNNILSSNRADYDLSRDILSHMRGLHKGDCNVLIAGETNAGKSSLLNLLLEMDVLPKSILGCTSDICKLKYSPSFSVLLIHRDGREERQSFSEGQEIKTFLEETAKANIRHVRQRGPLFKEVHIEVPADILKSGITIIDSPGFGENASLDSVASDFVINNDVAAFIYVIKTDSSGGVQEGKLIRFLKSILNIKVDKGDDSKYFDPKASLFVCNRWDLVSAREKPVVRDHVLQKLRGVWPDLDDEQVCFFSCKSRRSSVEHDMLHQALDTLFSLARDVVITNSFCWLKHIVKESAFCLRAIVHQTSKEKRDLNEKLLSAAKRLPLLETKTREIIRNLKQELEGHVSSLKESLQKYLVSKEVQKELSQWEVEDIPAFSTFALNNTKSRDETIIERIVEILDASDVTNDFIRNFIEGKVETEMSMLVKDMDIITNNLRDSSSSFRSSSSSGGDDAFGISSINESLFRRYPEGRSFSGLPFVEMSMGVVQKAISSLKRLIRRSSSADLNRPYVDMVKRSKTIAQLISMNEEVMIMLISRYTSSVELQIDRLLSRVPLFVTRIQSLITEISSMSSETEIRRHEIQKTMESLEQQKLLLAGFGYLYVNDIANDDIMMYMDDPSLKKSSRVRVDIDQERPDYLARVLWTRFLKGTLSADENVKPITIRYYIQPPDENHLYREIAKLRCLDHFAVAHFTGMTRAESQSAFIFRGDLRTAQSYLRCPLTDSTCTYSLGEAVPKLLEGLVEGLEYIHKDGLVHMELNANTVMVDSTGHVKLVGMCLPRQAKFPLDCDSIEAGDFTCLSPEVLKGEIYTATSDIYSFGLMVAEIISERPFKNERSWSLSKFRISVNPETMVNLQRLEYSKPLHNLLTGCLCPSSIERHSIDVLRALLQTLVHERIFDRLGLFRRINSRRPSALWSPGDFTPSISKM